MEGNVRCPVDHRTGGSARTHEVGADTADVPKITELAATVPAVTTNWKKTGQRIV